MNALTWIFLTALAVTTGVQLWLVRRQRAHVLAHRGLVPEAFRERIPLEAHQKAADYTATKASLHQLELLFAALVLLGWTLGGGLELLDRLWREAALPPLATGVLFLLSVGLISTLVEIPFSIYNHFVIEARFGFNRLTPKLYVVDLVKGAVLMLLLGAPLAALVLWLMERAGSLWWLYVWAVWMGFGVLIAWAYPTIIAPLFNTFSPLNDEALRSRIQALLERCGFTSSGIFVMDGSRRSSHGNAYFSGFGRSKRIVFFDTLIRSLAPAEIEAVLAHELGHFKRRHVLKNLALSASLSLGGLALLGYLIGQPWFYRGLGVSSPSLHAALALFVMVTPVFSLVLQPVIAWYSRRHEFEADVFAAEQADALELVHGLVKMYEENAATLTPDPLHSAFYDSHPPAALRVAHLQELARGGSGGAR